MKKEYKSAEFELIKYEKDEVVCLSPGVQEATEEGTINWGDIH